MNQNLFLLWAGSAVVSASTYFHAGSYNDKHSSAIVPAVASHVLDPQYNEGVLMLETQLAAVSIATAVEKYYDDYNRLPRPASTNSGADSETTTEGGKGIVTILIGKEKQNEIIQNPRYTNYAGSLKPAQPNNNPKAKGAGASAKWVNGLVFVNDNYEIVDSWGNYFKMKLDTNYDQKLDNPKADENAQGRRSLTKRVLVWSAGPDGKAETWEDNPRSW